MAAPRIVFNSINVDLPVGAQVYFPGRMRKATAEVSDGGITETIRTAFYDELDLSFDPFAEQSIFDALRAWHAWASRGKQFSFALDSSKTVNTTLVNNESAGATVIELASLTGISAGRYLMRSADLLNEEIVTVASTGGGAATLSAGTKFAYSTGDTFRDIDYFPKLILLDDRAPFRENVGLTYSLTLRCREDRA